MTAGPAVLGVGRLAVPLTGWDTTWSDATSDRPRHQARPSADLVTRLPRALFFTEKVPSAHG
jgi:hypothetical protein